MKKHVKIYLQHFNYTIADFIECRYCKKRATDIHHLIFKSLGGKDEINNLIALCRDCHNRAHNEPKFNEKLKVVTKLNKRV